MMLDLDILARAPMVATPFPHIMAENLLSPSDLLAVGVDFPSLPGAGLFPAREAVHGPAFGALLDAVESSAFETILSEKYGMDLSSMPLMVTVRGHCRARDGQIHNDSVDKVVTGLLYLNQPDWQAQGGRLRLLNGCRSLDDHFAEVVPSGGTFVSFRRTDRSWHGHASFEGPRRYIMFNWMASQSRFARNVGRHRLSAAVKRIFGGSR